MTSYLFNALGFVGVILQLVVVYYLLNGAWRKFPVVLVYSAARLIANLSEAYVYYRLGRSALTYVKVYWTAEVLMNILTFLMVIVLTQQALEGMKIAAQTGKLLNAVMVLAVLAPLAIYHQRTLFSTRWFAGVLQWTQFGAAIMNLGLWTGLLANRKRDPQLLAVSIGLGIMATGAALALGLRQFTPTGSEIRNIGNLVGQLAHLLGVFVWCWAFRGANSPRPDKPAAPGPLLTLTNTDSQLS